MVSRRRILAGTSIGALSGIAGCLSSSSIVGGAELSTWTPAENTWPLPWYDPENTSYNPDAEPPRTSVERTRSVAIESAAWGTPLILSEAYVAVSGPNGGVFRRDDLSSVWNASTTVRDAAFAPPGNGTEQRLYVATHEQTDDQPKTTILALALEEDTVDVVFETEFPDTASMMLLATESHLFMGTFAGDAVILDSSGDEKCTLEGLYGAVSGSQVVTENVGPVRRYDTEASGFFGNGLEEVWKNRGGYSTSYPAIAEDTVLVGSSDFGPPSDGYLHAFDFVDGELRWEPRSFGEYTGTPAIAGDTCYVTGHNPITADRDNGRIAAVDLNGSTIWDRTVDWYPHNPVVTGNGTLLVFHLAYEPYEYPDLARLVAYDAQTGDELWTYESAAPIRSVCPVGDEIYVGTREAVEVLE